MATRPFTPDDPDFPNKRHWRGRLAGFGSRDSRPSHDPEVVEAKRNYRTLQLAEHVRKILDMAPPLTCGQRDWLATLCKTYTPQGEAASWTGGQDEAVA